MILFKDLDIGDIFSYDNTTLQKISKNSALNLEYPSDGKRRVYYLSPYNEVA
jgi:hypothetical protein